ncbi:SDR family oxidoreductase [Thermoleophilia bacterium SCSIO 60948]|nr:SDR family oxidoreductase [Thermoleophilia bacterium SCSIO 60948]
MQLGIEGRVALVLGASKGIGFAVAEALAREGAAVALASRSEERIGAAAEKVGSGAIGIAADTDDVDAMRALPDRVADRLGPVEILVTNTGGPPKGVLADSGEADREAAHRSLVLAPWALIEAVLPGMRERGWGRIVNVGSSSIHEPIDGLALSNVYRPGALGLFGTLAREVAADGITVNTVGTGRFATDRLAENWGSRERMERDAPEGIPAGRLGRPEEFGDLVAFLCSERAAYLTGALIPLDGGLTHSI